MILKLAYYGDPILRKRSQPVDEINDEIRTLVHNMIETMVEKNGIGLAAPQVHVDKRLFLTAVPIEQEDGEWIPGTLRVFINPTIISVSKELDTQQEGCLSIPKIYGDVERPTTIVVEATNLEGELFRLSLTGLEARCVLHENDHINGVLFPDRMNQADRKEIQKQLKKFKVPLE